MEIIKELPFILTSDNYKSLVEYIKFHKEKTGVLLDCIYFNEEEYYLERTHFYYCGYFFQYGFRDPDRKLTKEELNRAYWKII